jgi:hypothetical protein
VKRQQRDLTVEDLKASILRLHERGFTVAEIEAKFIDLLAYAITRRLLSPETLATLRRDANKWPAGISALLGVAR